jgi:O-antigen biosynthesis protein
MKVVGMECAPPRDLTDLHGCHAVQPIRRGTRPHPARAVARPAPPASGPLVTVAVCTRDRPDDLRRCLASLSALEYPRIDIIVIDNAPTTDAAERVVRTFPGVRYAREPRPGLSRARNFAVAAAVGDIIAFTDDDVIVDPGWVSALVQVFVKDASVAAVTGLVVPLELKTDAQLHFERYGGFGCGFERRRFQWPRDDKGVVRAYRGDIAECGTGANMAFRRDVLDRIGRFDPCLGAGTHTHGGEDLESFFRILKEGHVIVYEPVALVRHRHRRGHDELEAQVTSWGTGMVGVLARSAERYPEERMPLLRLGMLFFGRSLRRIATALVRHPGFPRRLLLAELRGTLTGWRRYQTARAAALGIGAATDTAAA